MATIEQRLQQLADRLQADADNPPVGLLDVRVSFESRARDARAAAARIPDVIAALEDIHVARITGPEKEAVRVCIAKVKELLGGGE